MNVWDSRPCFQHSTSRVPNLTSPSRSARSMAREMGHRSELAGSSRQSCPACGRQTPVSFRGPLKFEGFELPTWKKRLAQPKRRRLKGVKIPGVESRAW